MQTRQSLTQSAVVVLLGIVLYTIGCLLATLVAFVSLTIPTYLGLLRDVFSIAAAVLSIGLPVAWIPLKLIDSPLTRLAEYRKQWLLCSFIGPIAGVTLLLVTLSVLIRSEQNPEFITRGLILIACGVIAGAVAGFTQWLVLRRLLARAYLWILAVAFTWGAIFAVLLYFFVTTDGWMP
jgi:hypothetical protein